MTPVAKDYLSELVDYYEVFDDWQGEGPDRKLEKELVHHVLTNRKKHAEKLGL